MADAWNSFVNGKATLNGGSYDFAHLTDVGGSSLNVLGGGVLTLSSLANAESLALLAKGAGSSIELPNLTTFAGPASNVTVGDGGSIARSGNDGRDARRLCGTYDRCAATSF